MRLGERLGATRARSCRRRTGAALRESAGSGDRLRRPEHQARAVVLEQQGVRLGVGVGQRMAGAHGCSASRRGRRRLPARVGAGFGGAAAAASAGGVLGRDVPGELCGAAIGTTLSSSRGSGGSDRRLVDRHAAGSAAAAGPAGTRGSGRSGRPRACSRSSASRITVGRRKTIRLVRFRSRVSLRNSAPRYGMSPSSGTFDLLSV